jgi:hypothetical protein
VTRRRSLVASARRRVDCDVAVTAASRRSSTDSVTRIASDRQTGAARGGCPGHTGRDKGYCPSGMLTERVRAVRHGLGHSDSGACFTAIRLRAGRGDIMINGIYHAIYDRRAGGHGPPGRRSGTDSATRIATRASQLSDSGLDWGDAMRSRGVARAGASEYKRRIPGSCRKI